MTSHFAELVQAATLAVVLLWALDRACQDAERHARRWLVMRAPYPEGHHMAEVKTAPQHSLTDDTHVELIRGRRDGPPLIPVQVEGPDPDGRCAFEVAQNIACAMAARRAFGNRRQGLA